MTNRILLLSIIVFSFLLSCKEDQITNPKPEAVKYDTVKICEQVWMLRNLDVDHYRNGDSIPEVRDSIEWRNLKTGAWCYYKNDSAMGKIFGKLYNWYAVNDSRGLSPAGWHVPTDDEWKELEMCLGMSQPEADEIGYRGTDQSSQLAGRADLWRAGALTSNTKFGTSGFSALPGGFRDDHGWFNGFYDIGYSGGWWSSADSSATNAWYRELGYTSANIVRCDNNKVIGFSVRCVKD